MPVWNEIDRFLTETENGALPFSELEERLVRMPYGLKRGVLPFIYAVTLIVFKDELALYEDGLYTPSVSEELLERLARRTQGFSVQRFRLAGLRAALLSEYAAALFKDNTQEVSLLAIAQPRDCEAPLCSRNHQRPCCSASCRSRAATPTSVEPRPTKMPLAASLIA